MDVKVYKKEEVRQPSGSSYVYVPDVIDIIPNLIEKETTRDVKDGVWSLETLKTIADVSIENKKLVINSNAVRFIDGKLVINLTTEQITGVEELQDDSKDLLEQECALATIWQRGLDPLDKEDGIRWSEALLGEVNSLQLMEEITEAVSNVSTSVIVNFETIEDAKGNIFLTYKLEEVL